MVIAKTLIKNHAQNQEAPGTVFTQTNEQLCEGNDAGLFVTGWMGVLEISTGKFVYVNAGHNPPLLKRAGGPFEWLKSRPGFVLAGMEGVRYRENTLQLEPGDGSTCTPTASRRPPTAMRSSSETSASRMR